MAKRQLNLVYALQDEELVHVSQVERGLGCNCICPHCKNRLIARKGNKVIHHFAHCDTEMCEHGYETSIHIAAKEIIAKSKKIWIPPVYFRRLKTGDNLIHKAMELHVDEVLLEKRTNDFVPDIIIRCGHKELILEIYVTHAVGEEKRAKIEASSVSAIEIDLSKASREIEPHELESLLLGLSNEKHWIHNTVVNTWTNLFLSMCEELKVIHRGFAPHVEYCPKKARIWRGKSYANFIDDCSGCEFLVDYWDNDLQEYMSKGIFTHTGVDAILCSGRKRISTLVDLKAALGKGNATSCS